MADLEKLLSTDSKVEALQKINAIIENGGRIEEKIASLIPDNSELIASYGIPDYSAGVSLTYTTTNTNFPFSGVAYFGYRGASNTSAKIYVNDIEFGLNGSSASNISGQTAYIVSQNDVYRYQTTSDGQYGIIYPMKGTK